MEGPSIKRPRAPSPFSRGRLLVGLVLVAILASGAAFGLSKLRSGPNLGRVVYATEDGVFERDLATAERKRLASLPDDMLDAWPDREGRWVGYLTRRLGLWLLDLRTGERWQVSERNSTSFGWSPDGRFIAAELAADRDLVAIDPDGRGTDLLASGYGGGRPLWTSAVTFVTTLGRSVVRIDVAAERPRLRKLTDEAWSLSVSPDGTELLYVRDPEGSRPRVAIAELEDGRLGPSRTVFRGVARRAATSRQGVVAFSGRDSDGEGGTWVLTGRDEPPRRVSRDQAELVDWSLDGSSLLTVINGSLVAHDLRDRREIRLSPRGAHVKGFAVVA